MIRWREGTVTGLRRRWRGAVELVVALTPGPPGPATPNDQDPADKTPTDRAPADPATGPPMTGRPPEVVRAVAYPALVGEPRVGDRVLLNLTGMTLGTGGYAQVVAVPDRLPADAGPTAEVVKARYTPLQVGAVAAEDGLDDRDGLAGMPVVTADLHSAVPAILAGIRNDRPDARVAYVLTDGGALAAWFSQTLDAITPLLAGTVTVGQAYGGDLEATNVHTGLLVARYRLGADVTIVAPGPGTLGTGTTWGFSGTAVGEAVNAVATLCGRPVGAVRISDADPRERHRGVSHHCLTAYGRVALAPADLVVPAGLPTPLATTVRAALAPLAAPDRADRPGPARHRVVEVDPDGLDAALRALPWKLITMGRDLDADHAYFLAAAAAGRHAASLLPA